MERVKIREGKARSSAKPRSSQYIKLISWMNIIFFYCIYRFFLYFFPHILELHCQNCVVILGFIWNWTCICDFCRLQLEIMTRDSNFMTRGISTQLLFGHRFVTLMVMRGFLDIEATQLKSWPRVVLFWKWRTS